MMLVCGSTGNDLILGGDNNDALLGEAGNDIMIGMGGTNYLFGGSDDDILLTGGITSRPSHNFNDGGLNTPTGKDVCQKGLLGVDLAGCEIHLP
jgi:Ca2+-binding RTX toxin-like protein